MTTKTNDATLTEKELKLLNSMRLGMDEANTGWLHEVAYGIFDGKTLSGLVASLVKKGCITSDYDDSGEMGCYWIEVKTEWWTQESFDAENQWRADHGQELLTR